MLAERDAELRELARAELARARGASARRSSARSGCCWCPRIPNDEKNVILEIRAGTGGDEAALFAAELFRMYARYAERRGWKVEPLSHLRDRAAAGSRR